MRPIWDFVPGSLRDPEQVPFTVCTSVPRLNEKRMKLDGGFQILEHWSSFFE